MKKIGIIVGSLREKSYSKAVAAYISSILPHDFSPVMLDISELAIYNEDLEVAPPAPWVNFRDSAKAVDAILFVTPEYNRSSTGALKNALDVGSRPYGNSVWAKKPAGIISISPGRMGAFGANHHLRQSLVFLDMFTLQQPEMYIGDIANVLNESGNVTSDFMKNAFKDFVVQFVNWINLFE